MTEQNKENLLKYLVGDLSQETGDNKPIFKDFDISANNTKKQIADSLEIDVSLVRLRGFINPSEMSNLLIYGENSSTNKSFISIFNYKMELLTTTTKLSSGSDLFRIYSLKQAEDGTIYGLSQDGSSPNYTLRVLLFNNILGSGLLDGNYQVVLRKSYTVPVSDFHVVTLLPSRDIIVKAQDEPIYYITGNGDSATYTRVVKFTINVQEGNTWDTYTIGTNVRYAQMKFSVLLNKRPNGYVYTAYGLDIQTYRYIVYQIDENGTVTNLKNISYSGTISFNPSQVLALNENNVYVSIGDVNLKQTILYYVEGNSLVEIERENWYTDPGGTSNIVYYNLQNINGNAFVTKYTPYRYAIRIEVGMLIEKNIYYKVEGQQTSIEDSYSLFNYFSAFNNTFINNQYNLFLIYINSDYNNQSDDFTINKLPLVYNVNNYNGESFVNNNVLLPKSGILYDDDGNIIFARNLYNKTINGNTTTSFLQIPNTILNDVQINKQELYSNNNLLLNENNQNIEKNIYETLYINFVNTINILNRNENEIVNQEGANRLNLSSTNIIDYQQAKGTNVRVNFVDGTKLLVTPMITKVTDTKYKYTFELNVRNNINTIDIISADGDSVYQQINGDNFGINKTYRISQDVWIS